MLVALGMDTLVRPLQESNALPPMLVALGKDTSVRTLQESNAPSPMLIALDNFILSIDLSIYLIM